jgi:hypothetical protein
MALIGFEETRVLEKDQYCRDVETYLCRKNHGHLIRIVGPAFELVCAWAERGVPLKVTYRGIDRFVERQEAKGHRRRPARIEFCEADVLDAFDEWRRAVGLTGGAADGAGDSNAVAVQEGGDAPAAASRSSLASHLERTLVALRSASVGADTSLAEAVGQAVREVEEMRSGSGTLRGAARQAALERLRSLDAELLMALRSQLPADQLAEAASEADEQLAPFKARMPYEAHQRARQACIDRLLRERTGLPVVAFE